MGYIYITGREIKTIIKLLKGANFKYRLQNTQHNNTFSGQNYQQQQITFITTVASRMFRMPKKSILAKQEEHLKLDTKNTFMLYEIIDQI
jgi:hypothetical protein